MRTGQASRTAMVVAYLRAMGDRGVTSVPRFSDPFARELLDGPLWRLALGHLDRVAHDRTSSAAANRRAHVDCLVLRVRFIDVVLEERALPQVVILGAGLDTRAYRLPALSGVRVFEVDHPDTQAYKRARAARLGPPIATLTYVPVDFTRDDLSRELTRAGFDATRPTLWIWEGVTMYLDDRALGATLDAVRVLSAPTSALVTHYHEREASAVARAVRVLLLGLAGEPQVGLRTPAQMHAALARHGFRVVEDAGIAEQAARTGTRADVHVHLTVSRLCVAEPQA
jgi:methyltransferase (TIGR00027 family)